MTIERYCKEGIAVALLHGMALCERRLSFGCMCPRVAFLVCTRTDMVIDGKKEIYLVSPQAKETLVYLVSVHASARVFFYERCYSAADGHLG